MGSLHHPGFLTTGAGGLAMGRNDQKARSSGTNRVAAGANRRGAGRGRPGRAALDPGDEDGDLLVLELVLFRHLHIVVVLHRDDERTLIGTAGDDGGLGGVAALEHGVARGQAEAALAFALGVARGAVLVQQGPDLGLKEIDVGRGELRGKRTARNKGENAEGGANPDVTFHVRSPRLLNGHRAAGGRQAGVRRKDGPAASLSLLAVRVSVANFWPAGNREFDKMWESRQEPVRLIGRCVISLAAPCSPDEIGI